VHNANVPFQQELIVTVTRKGQITIPAVARKFLHTDRQRTLSLVIDPEGSLRLKPPKYPTIESLAGAAGSLPQHLKGLSWREMVDIAHEDLAEPMASQDP
jgi:bifunctional DNA-binding transcriptional regulator/antitoxin component of YhaV-PrlF toxin-antitoxin module